MSKPISLNVLDQIEIASPCTARWEEMTGDDRTRHCSHCSLNVYNISAMTKEEATTLVAGAEGRVCIRLYRRTDGTVLTQDCPTGLRAARQRLHRSIRNIAATTVTLLAGMFGLGSREASAQELHIMGQMVAPERVDPPDTTTNDSVEPTYDSTRTTPVDSADLSIAEPDTDEPDMMFEMGEVMITCREQPTPVTVEPISEEPVETREHPIDPINEEPVTGNLVDTGAKDPVEEPISPPDVTPVEAIDRPRIR